MEDIDRCLDQADLQQLSDDLKILGHPIRLQILDVLSQSEGRACVCDLEAELPIKQPTISHHLRILSAAGLVEVQRDGLWAYYFIRRDALSAMKARINSNLAAIN
ncbi:MAG: metalloregulator ArsR/SmtB family transcription factor [Anaerolineales bacterium]|nr:metalloregulator ArsR/SmtB family transcription factor [Anaerolineales bacterium]